MQNQLKHFVIYFSLIFFCSNPTFRRKKEKRREDIDLNRPGHRIPGRKGRKNSNNKEWKCVEAKKYCWYFEGRYPIYFICRSYEDCCGTRCCVRALSIQRLWYFWVLLMMGVLFCCGAGFFVRRRMYPSPLRDEPAFNVSFTRHPATSPVSQQPGSMQGFGVNGMTGGDPGVAMAHPAFAHPPQPGSAHMMMAAYPPPPSYCNHPPPSYEQIFHNSDKK